MPIDEENPFGDPVPLKEKIKQVPSSNPGMPEVEPGGTTWRVTPGAEPVPIPVQTTKIEK